MSKKALVFDFIAEARHGGGEDLGQAMGALGHLADALGAVVDGEHRGDDGEQHLRGADIAGRLFAADMLLAGLHRHAQAPGGPAASTDTPMMRPGMARLNSSRVAKKAACGPP